MKIVLTPDWFLGKDVLIEIFSFIVLFIFCYLCFKNYKLNKNKKILYLGIGFGLIGLAELATIFTKLVLYYDNPFTQTIGDIMVSYDVVNSVDIFYHLGFFFYRLLMLLGLYAIYKMPVRKGHMEESLLTLFFIFLLSISSRDMSYLFHLATLVLLALITKNYYMIYTENASNNTRILVFAFSLLCLSNVIFIASNVEAMFVVANLIGLASYIILLVLIIRILKYGTEKKQNRHNLRHTGNNQGTRG